MFEANVWIRATSSRWENLKRIWRCGARLDRRVSLTVNTGVHWPQTGKLEALSAMAIMRNEMRSRCIQLSRNTALYICIKKRDTVVSKKYMKLSFCGSTYPPPLGLVPVSIIRSAPISIFVLSIWSICVLKSSVYRSCNFAYSFFISVSFSSSRVTVRIIRWLNNANILTQI